MLGSSPSSCNQPSAFNLLFCHFFLANFCFIRLFRSVRLLYYLFPRFSYLLLHSYLFSRLYTSSFLSIQSPLYLISLLFSLFVLFALFSFSLLFTNTHSFTFNFHSTLFSPAFTIHFLSELLHSFFHVYYRLFLFIPFLSFRSFTLRFLSSFFLFHTSLTALLTLCSLLLLSPPSLTTLSPLASTPLSSPALLTASFHLTFLSCTTFPTINFSFCHARFI